MEHELQQWFKRTPASASSARQFLGDAVGRLGVRVDLEALTFLASELVSAAVQRGGQGGFSVVVCATDEGGVRVVVSDPSELDEAGKDRHELVGKLLCEIASSWALERAARGTRISFELKASSAPPNPAKH